MAHLQDIAEDVLGKMEYKKFSEWAFGSQYEDFDSLLSFMKKWNELHGDVFKISVRGDIHEDVTRMVSLYNAKKDDERKRSYKEMDSRETRRYL